MSVLPRWSSNGFTWVSCEHVELCVTNEELLVPFRRDLKNSYGASNA
jgi:hypothetical protein